MLHVVTSANRHLYRKQLGEMHRQRYELFVKGKGWKLPVRHGGEYDQGDDDRAVYLLALDETGYCDGSIRVRPADDWSYLLDAMPEWVAVDAQTLRANPGLWEMARWIKQGEDPSTGAEMRIGLVEYLLTRGATQCLACGDLDVVAYGIRTGWRVNFLGVPRRYPEGGVAVATSLPISRAEADHLREVYDRRDLFLMEVPPGAAWAGLPLPAIEQGYRTAAEGAADVADLRARADQLLSAELTRHFAA